jgi:hypothetical protein
MSEALSSAGRPSSVRRVAALTAAAVGCLVAAQPASAGQIVWEKGGSGNAAIWVMDDDGQNQRPLITLGDAPGMSFIGSPHVHPLGGQAVVFKGSTTQNSVTFGSRTYSGNNATGVYRWAEGTTTRLSPPPSPCSTTNTGCTTFETDPEAAADGSYVSQSGILVGGSSSTDFHYELTRGSLATGATSEFPTQCSDDSNVSYGPESPSPNPVNPAEVAYGGCDPEIEGSDYGIWIKTDTGMPSLIADSGEALRDAAWKLDGSAVLVVAADSGIYEVARDGNSARQVFAGEASNPRDIGGRILFESGWELYTLPADCNACTLASATQLTSGGDNGPGAWTSAATFPAGPGDGDDQDDQGDQGGEQVDGAAPSVEPSLPGRLKLRRVLKRGLAFDVELGEPATVRAVISVDGRAAKRLRLVRGARRGRVVVGKVSRSLPQGTTRLRVPVTKKHARKLRRARSLNLRLALTATDAAGNKGKARRTLKLKR